MLPKQSPTSPQSCQRMTLVTVLQALCDTYKCCPTEVDNLNKGWLSWHPSIRTPSAYFYNLDKGWLSWHWCYCCQNSALDDFRYKILYALQAHTSKCCQNKALESRILTMDVFGDSCSMCPHCVCGRGSSLLMYVNSLTAFYLTSIIERISLGNDSKV